MRTLAIICYAVALLAESGGLVLVVLTLRADRSALLRWRAANPLNNEGGSYDQTPLVNQIVTQILDEPRWRQRVAVGLIALGIVSGALGNFASLASA